jgi:hypothetical protein
LRSRWNSTVDAGLRNGTFAGAFPAPPLEARLDAGVLAGAVPVAAVEDLALVEHDRLQEPVLADVGDELSELGAVDREQREGAAGWGSSSAGGAAGWSVGVYSYEVLAIRAGVIPGEVAAGVDRRPVTSVAASWRWLCSAVCGQPLSPTSTPTWRLWRP